MLQKANAAAARKNRGDEEESSSGPRLAFTGNAKLDELLAGIKETVYKYEEVVFPSQGKFYDGIVAPADGVIHVRCMTGEEEQILATPRYIKKGQAINMIFKNCVRENIQPEKLLTIDRTWLLIYLRGISYSPEYEVEVRCTECQTRFQTQIDLDKMLVNRCPEHFNGDSMEDILPKSGYRFSYRLATGKDENMIQDHRDRRIKQNTDGGHDDTWTYRASLLINNIEGLDDQVAIQALISRLPIQDVAYIRNLLVDPPFGVDTKVSIICANCSEEFQVEMPMDTNFFFPKPRKAKK
jgi:DNA-directed RNA polymerase subunit RPC12/RpoP